MKRIIVAILSIFIIQTTIRADVVVYNDTDFDIKFGMAWIGPVLYNCPSLDKKCWAESTTWDEPIKAHRRRGRGGELNNLKTRYTISADLKKDGNFTQVASKEKLLDAENRDVFVTYDDATKKFKIESEGWHGDRNMRQSWMQGIHKGPDYFTDQPVVRGFAATPFLSKKDLPAAKPGAETPKPAATGAKQ